MRKLCFLMIVILTLTTLPLGSFAEAQSFGEAPMLAERVELGELPPVEERIPANPRVAIDFLEEELVPEVGKYGGTVRNVSASVNWNPDIFIALSENLLNMASINSDVIEPNIVESFEISEDYKTYTFTLRKGLKWSNGVEVKMEDVIFTVENFIYNEELTPVVPNWMTADGKPFEFKVIDDYTFSITFSQPKVGLVVYLTAASYNGYSDWIKPAYYLKPFHKDFAEECHGSLEAYYEFLQPFGTLMGYDDVTADGVWVYIFNQVDLTTWEITDPIDCLTTKMFPDLVEEDFPVLYPWVMVSDESNVQTWERNAYYHKVDIAGNQLPYFDYITNELVEDVQMVQVEVIGGDVDLLRESATVDNISLYRENEEAANINPLLCKQGNTPTDLFLNVNYGLNIDGSVKDDPDSQAWQEVIVDERFRHAIAMSIDAQEILDSIYYGLGEVRPGTMCTHDIDGANDLLDEMGMLDIDGDGYRETPSGKPFQFQIWNANEATDIVPTIELYCEYMSEIGIKASGYTVESSLLGTSQAANEVPARCGWSSFSIYWYFDDTYSVASWAPLWAKWFTAGCPTDEAAQAEYLIPQDEETLAFFETLLTHMQHEVSEITNVLRPEILEFIDGNCYDIRPLDWVGGICVLNADMGNIPEGTIAHTVNYFLEDLYFDR